MGGSLMRRITGVLVLSSAILLLAQSVAQAATPTKVLDRAGVDESTEAASTSYFAWSQNLPSKPNHYNTYVRPIAGGSRQRVNQKGTKSYTVGIDGSLVVFDANRGEDSDLRFYDAATQARPAMPHGVNTRSIEFRPTLSGDWLLFTRNSGNHVTSKTARTKIILFNVTTKESRVLASGSNRRTYLVSDQVNGDWATFERCHFDRATGQFSNCNVFRYTVSTKALVKIPNPGKQQYAAAISQDGTVYMVRTGGPNVWQCGQNTRIVRYPVGGPSVTIARIGSDALTTFATDETYASTTLYFQKYRCNSGSGGIYRIQNADTVT
jgi:hypothetical protein